MIARGAKREKREKLKARKVESLENRDKFLSMIKNFEQLDVWKRSCQLAVATYKIFEKVKDYGLCNQVTRAAVSVPSNIAEGSERQTAKEFIQFLYCQRLYR